MLSITVVLFFYKLNIPLHLIQCIYVTEGSTPFNCGCATGFTSSRGES